MASVGDKPCPPVGTVDCEAEVQPGTNDTVYLLINPKKQENYILGEVSHRVLDFIVYNLPRTQPPTGCPGRWLFLQMVTHFQASGTIISAIGGNWSRNSTNLNKVNDLTKNDAMKLEDATKLTNTGLNATVDAGYTNVQIIFPDPNQLGSVGTRGTQGNYTSVHVRFTP